jgi:predicted ArsR family transcriptional regulator
MSTRRRIVKLLKTEGPMDSAKLAARLDVTPMAVRQHLYALEREKLVDVETRPGPIGRPAKYWKLTTEANRLFPEAYAELSVSLINSVNDAFGPSGMTRLLDARLVKQRANYGARITRAAPLKKRLQQLAKVRTEEGYMAEVNPAGPNAFLFVENHCPICAAATVCQGFCAIELDLFRSVLGRDVIVEREEHIVGGDRRCAYRITATK